MKKRRKIKAIKSKGNKVSLRNPIAPPSIRHSALKGTGYNRLEEKKNFKREVEEYR